MALAVGQLRTAAPRASAGRSLSRCAALGSAPRLAGASLAAARAARPARRLRGDGVTRAGGATNVVITVDSEAAYESLLTNTPADKLLVVECSATWCGPCTMFKPAYEQFAEAYVKDAVFVTIMGDINNECKQLMSKLGVKSVPAFFFFKGGKQVSSFTGANKTAFRTQLAQFIKL